MTKWAILVAVATLVINQLVLSEKPSITQDCFTAAVFEHVHEEDVTTDDPKLIIQKNIEALERAAEEAKKQGADIVVLPEYGVYSIPNDTREYFIEHMVENIPDADGKRIPCDSPNDYQEGSFVVPFSCLAKKHKMYVVGNGVDAKPCDKANDPNCPADGVYIYNTNIVFDREGRLIARYHKRHPFVDEYMLNAPAENEFVYFDTEFGRFGTFICFDIMFKEAVQLVEKYDIDTVLYPTWWFDGQPFKISNQVHQAFAIVNKVNLLAANIHSPREGTLGSGIYAGVNGAVNTIHTPDGRAKLLISRIPSRSGPGKTCEQAQPSTIKIYETVNTNKVRASTPLYTGFSTDISRFVLSPLLKPEDKLDVCHNDFCCSLEYQLLGKEFEKEEKFYFGVYNGTEDAKKHNFWSIEACVLAKMYPEAKVPEEPQIGRTSTTRFNRVSISGKFTTNYVYPSVLTAERVIVDKSRWHYEFNEETKAASITVGDINEPILTVALYGRAYDRDPEFKQAVKSSNNKL